MGTVNNDSSDKNENLIHPREKIINTAVTFLSDKNIQKQDQNMLKKFLLKKGLTEEEVTIAFQRHETTKMAPQNLVTEYSQPMSHFAPPLPLPQSPSVWHLVHSVVTTVTSIGGILYALYWLWKTYIMPYLFGRKPKKKPVETSLAELEAAVGGCVGELKSVSSSLQALSEQQAETRAEEMLVSRISEVKAEVNSLKALLLNRSQFPATPVPLGPTPLSIPAWQLSAENTEPSARETEAEVEEEGSGSNGTTNGSDSSLEIVKDPNH